MAADLADTPVTANILLPGGATATGERIVARDFDDWLQAREKTNLPAEE